MSEASTCAWDGCFENIEHVCEVCKKSFCDKHAKKGQFVTGKGKLQYATLCLTDQEVGETDQRYSSDNVRILKQFGIFAAIIIVILLLIDQFVTDIF